MPEGTEVKWKVLTLPDGTQIQVPEDKADSMADDFKKFGNLKKWNTELHGRSKEIKEQLASIGAARELLDFLKSGGQEQPQTQPTGGQPNQPWNFNPQAQAQPGMYPGTNYPMPGFNPPPNQPQQDPFADSEVNPQQIVQAVLAQISPVFTNFAQQMMGAVQSQMEGVKPIIEDYQTRADKQKREQQIDALNQRVTDTAQKFGIPPEKLGWEYVSKLKEGTVNLEDLESIASEMMTRSDEPPQPGQAGQSGGAQGGQQQFNYLPGQGMQGLPPTQENPPDIGSEEAKADDMAYLGAISSAPTPPSQ